MVELRRIGHECSLISSEVEGVLSHGRSPVKLGGFSVRWRLTLNITAGSQVR